MCASGGKEDEGEKMRGGKGERGKKKKRGWMWTGGGGLIWGKKRLLFVRKRKGKYI